ncbi:polysaccharide biosynthesis tyrosine autokinase [Lyngbya aestuarii]|uniref:polysaccharide biosynthesis tyrosine autokinase n=1 Tax=Lyngbya aestuarii TaxID=118322 RepID=UPI00403E2032
MVYAKMNQEQDSQILSISKQGRQLQQQLPLDDEVELSAPPQKGLNLAPLLRIVQRRVLLIAGITALATAAAALMSSRSPSSYKGSFQLLAEPVTSEQKLADPSTLARNQGRVDDRAFELDYSTTFEILTGPGTLSDIVKEVQTQYPDFNIGQLTGLLTVERLDSAKFGGKTKIMQVSYEGLDPDLVQLVIEKTADKYLKYSLEERKTSIGQGIEFIEEQLPERQKRVDGLQADLQKVQQQYNLIDPTVQGEDLYTRVREITNEQLATQRELQEQKTLYVNLQKQLSLSPEEAIAASALSEDPSYNNLLAKLKDVESQIAAESARFQPGSPEIQALQEQRQNLQNLLSKESQRILGQNLTATTNPQVLSFQNPTRITLIQRLVDTRNQIEVLEVRNQELAKAKNAFEQQANQFPAIANQYNRLQRQLDLATKTLNDLLTQRESLRVEAAQTEVPWELVSDPSISRDATGNPIPQAGSASKLLLMGVMGGLFLGMGVALVYEKSRNIFYSTEDLEDATKLPLLGMIPPQKSPLFLEAFDSLYTNIRFRFSTSPIRSLVVGSPTPEDGKSTVALHLAKTAAAMGQRVLLVDANLRSPQLHTRLDLQNFEGLSDLLDNKLALNDLIERSPHTDNLFVLTSGQYLPDSPKLLASDKMQYLKEKFQEKFDLVIYDTPNFLDYTDASFLADHIDGILMVVAIHKTKQSLVQKTLEQLNTFGLPILGVVANRVKPSSLTTSPQARKISKEVKEYEKMGSASG